MRGQPRQQLYGRAQQRGDAVRPRIKLPDGYANQADFLQEMRQMFDDDLQSDRLNREAALEDLRFMVGDHWDDATRQRREAARKPVLTINRLPAFVAQVLGSRRLNETDIKIAPDNGSNVGVAQVREGLIRSIQKNSRADIAYDTALAGALMCGLGNFELELDYADDEAVANQDIKIKPIPDHLSVVWDRMCDDPTGADATRCSIVTTVTQQDYFNQWPWATPADVVTDINLRGDLRMTGWISINDFRVVRYWRIRKRKRLLALSIDGSTIDITDEKDPIQLMKIAVRSDGSPVIREVMKRYAQMYICSGLDVLEGPYELPIYRVPVFRVPGWEVRVGDWRHRFGLIRFLKDPQRLHNYWRSVIAEKLMQTPRATWMAAETAVQGRESQWRYSHLSDDPLLIWNAESGQKPERVQPAQMEESLLGQAEMTSQDLKDISNIHEANLGMPSNEVSQVAIMARQRVSDTGTIIYHDNLAKAIEECGRVSNILIPIAYDTERVVKVLGQDGQEYMQVINQFNDPKSIDITVGKYAVTAGVGPSYATKRIEQSAMMMGMAQAMPQILQAAADIIVEAQDWPDAEKIATRLKNMMPPQILGPAEQTPQTIARGQQQAAAQQKATQMQQQQALADYLKTQAEALLNMARAHNFQAEAAAEPQKMQNDSMRVAADLTHQEYQNRLDALRIAQGA